MGSVTARLAAADRVDGRLRPGVRYAWSEVATTIRRRCPASIRRTIAGSVTVTGCAAAMSAGRPVSRTGATRPALQRRGAVRVDVVELDEQDGLAGRRRGPEPHGGRADDVDRLGAAARESKRGVLARACRRRRRRAAW